ncbi:MAG: hypothetical protein ACK5NT_15290, partial [Pyrinomonadaceae bacterium]
MKKLSFLFAVTALVSLSAFAQKNFNRERTFDALNYTMRLSFDRDSKTVFGDSTIRFKPLADNFRVLKLDTEDTKFSKVTLVGSGVELPYKLEGKTIAITLDRNYSAGEEIEVRMVYRSKPKKGIYFVDAVKQKGKTLLNRQVWT